MMIMTVLNNDTDDQLTDNKDNNDSTAVVAAPFGSFICENFIFH